MNLTDIKKLSKELNTQAKEASQIMETKEKMEKVVLTDPVTDRNIPVELQAKLEEAKSQPVTPAETVPAKEETDEEKIANAKKLELMQYIAKMKGIKVITDEFWKQKSVKGVIYKTGVYSLVLKVDPAEGSERDYDITNIVIKYYKCENIGYTSSPETPRDPQDFSYVTYIANIRFLLGPQTINHKEEIILLDDNDQPVKTVEEAMECVSSESGFKKLEKCVRAVSELKKQELIKQMMKRKLVNPAGQEVVSQKQTDKKESPLIL